ncbi:hypothetical protein [Psychrobacter sp. I-STPA10]|uniref:hypothetical protein n=1 Tax=Psychrobacter sp. I-STPA10 TaxID=2585769 RepID=UPI001E5C42F6|nr:hypothetical protein [Psychrobacter sp. I-STPA10]
MEREVVIYSQKYKICSFLGKVVDTSRHSETEVYGDADRVNASVTVHDEFLK